MSSSTCGSSGTSRGLLRMEDEAKASELQGIGSILGSEPDKSKTAASLRRTLSADMSSKKWLGRNGFTPLKKIPSSESFPLHSSSVTSDSSSSSSASLSDGEEEDKEQVVGRTRKKPESEGQFDNWSPLVQPEQQQKEDVERPGLSDVWGSILSLKVDDSSKSSTAIYIPQQVKRSKSSLSQKSLEICTESLGSETGSDGFSSNPPSEASDFEDKPAEEQQSVKKETEQEADTVAEEEKMDLGAADYNSSVISKSPPRSFPPPLTSLARREGPGVLMRSHRREGRLVLEAVPVSSYNYFHSERQSGRLLLSFITNPSAELMEAEEEEEEEELEKAVEADVFDEFEGLEEEEETERVEKGEEVDGVQDTGIVTEVVKISQPTVMVPPCEVISVHSSAATLTNKLMGLSTKNPSWSHSHKMNVHLLEEEEEEEEEEVEVEEEEMEEPTQLPQSLPCPPRVARLIASPAASAAAAASFNAYDYFWRTKPTSAVATMHLTQEPPPAPPIIDNNNFCYYPNKLHNNKKINNNNKSVISKGGLKLQEQQKQTMVLRGNEADCLVPPVRGCKEPRRSLPIWQPPRCIATS